MRAHRCLAALVVWMATAAVARAEGEVPVARQVRGAIERSLPFLEREGVAWIKARKCMSCHVFSFTIWSHVEAQRHGIVVDEAKLADWIGWARDETLNKREWYTLTEADWPALADSGVPMAARDKLLPLKDRSFVSEQEFRAVLGGVLSAEELASHGAPLLEQAARPRSGKNDGGGLDTLHQLILGGAPIAGTVPDIAWTRALTELVGKWREPDGTWKAAGQNPLQNRPKAESNAVTTAWTTLALASIGQPDAAVKRPDATVDRPTNIQPGKSNESLIVRLLVEAKFGTPERTESLLNELRKQQNADGGWPWLLGGPSDAFATGQSLYALTRSGVSADDDAVHRARLYLLSTQAEDGAWSLPPENITGTTGAARRKNLIPIYRYWGTAWATIGLAGTLPAAAADDSPATERATR